MSILVDIKFPENFLLRHPSKSGLNPLDQQSHPADKFPAVLRVKDERRVRIFIKAPHMMQCFVKSLDASRGKIIALEYYFK